MIRFGGITIDRSARTVATPAGACRFGPALFRFVEALLLGGPQSRLQLFDIVYGGDADGGPLAGSAVIDVMLCHARPRLRAIGIAVMSGGPRGRSRTYWAGPEQPVITREAA